MRSSVSLSDIPHLGTGQLRKFAETKEIKSQVKERLALHKSLGHRKYPGEEVAVEDKIEVAIMGSSLAPLKRFLEDATLF